MATIALKVAGTSYTLTQAGMRSLVHSTASGQPARLTGQIYAAAIPQAAWAYGATVELWVNSTRRFAGWLGPVGVGFDAQGSYVSFTAADILARLRNTPLATRLVAETLSPAQTGADHYLYTLADTTTTEVTLFGGGQIADEDHEGYYRWDGSSSSATELARVCTYASSVFSPGLSAGTLLGLSAKNQAEQVVNLDCLSALQRCTKYRPDAVMWVDPSGTTPALHCITRDNCTPVTIHLADGSSVRDWSLTAREDLRLLYLQWTLKYTRRNAVAGGDISTSTASAYYEFGSSSAPADRRSVLELQVGTFSTDSSFGASFDEFPDTAAADYWAAMSALHYEGGCTLYVGDAEPYTWALGQAHNFTGGATEYATCLALVRAVSYDHVAGTVACEYGPPDTLSPSGFIGGSASGAIGIAPAPDGPSDPSAPTGDLPAQLTDGLYNLFSVLGTTGEVQTIEGTATINGWNEFAPSSPPKKFLKITAHQDAQYICPWSGSADGWSYYATGAYSWDGTTLTGPTYTGDRAICDDGYQNGHSLCGVYPVELTKTSTTSTLTVPPSGEMRAIGLCCASGHSIRFTGGSELYTLSEEDEEPAAIARLGSTWGKPIELSLRTYWQLRTSGFSFSVRRCRLHNYTWTCSIYGLPARVTIPLYRYPVGGTKPATPTATQPFILPLTMVETTTKRDDGLTLTERLGKATLPDWEMPYEQGMVYECGQITCTLL